MFLLAVLSFLQMTVIPGFLVLSYFHFTLESKLQALLYTFALSLLFNYLLVLSLTTAGIYKPIIIYTILSIEILLLLYYFTKRSKIVLNFKDYLTGFKTFWETKPFFYKLLFVLSMVMIGIFFYFFISRIKAVFYLNDPVLAWNRFTLDWYHNHFPVHTWRYPQLIPTNWSIAYIIMQNPDIQFVPRNIMAFSPIGTTALFLDLALRKKESTYLLALLFYGTIIIYLYRPAFIVGGYADIAVSFFAFLSFYALYSANKEGVFDIKPCLFSVAFASAAAVTKQIGFYILFFILAWNLGIIYKNKSLSKKRTIKVLLSIILLTGIIVGPWYVYKEIQIAKGIEKSELSMLTQKQHGNRTSYGERLIYGFKRIVNARGIPNVEFFIYGGLFLMLLSLFHKRIRYITLFIVFPFTLIWVFLFSYDYRNLTLAFPFMALSMAYGFDFLAKKFISRPGKKPPKHGIPETAPKVSLIKWQNLRLPKYNISILPLAGVITALLVLLNFTIFKKESIIKNQLTQLKNIGDIRLNEKLYRYYEENGLAGRVFSRYPYYKYLPVLRDYWAPERQDNNVHYFLDTFSRPDKESVKLVKKKLKTGEYTLLFKHNEYLFIKIK
jgi:hypothetical protein